MTHRPVPVQGLGVGACLPTGLLAGGLGGMDEGLEVPKVGVSIVTDITHYQLLTLTITSA